MAASATDKLKKLSRRWVGQIGAGGVSDAVVTTIPLSSTTNLATDTAVVATIDRVDANGTATASLEETIIGVVSGANLVSCVRGSEGTAQAHSAGAVVEILVTAKGWNDIIDHLLVGHLQDGRHAASAITASNVAASAVVAGNISASAVTAGNLAASAVVAGNLAASAVVAGNLAASAVTMGNMAASSVGTGNLNFVPVTMTGSETLTNKTLTDPVINYTDKSITMNVKAAARLNAAQSVNSGAITGVIYDTELYDIGSDYNTSTGLFTAPVTGYYFISHNVTITSLKDGGRVISYIYVNSANVLSTANTAGVATNVGACAAGVFYVTSGQTIGGYVYHDHGSARDVVAGAGESTIFIHLLST
jgi:hypothetical protein